jgi:hypothetical protein
MLYGRYYFKNINFAGVNTEFDIPHLVRFEIEDCLSYTDKGGSKGMVAKYDPLYGYVKGFNEIINKGNYIAYNVSGIEVNGVPLLKGYKFVLSSVKVGTIDAGMTKAIIAKLDNATSVLNSYNDIIIGKFNNFKAPAGLIMNIEIADEIQNEIEIQLTNTTRASINIGSRDVLVNVLKN